jgi:hypothetical protein
MVFVLGDDLVLDVYDGPADVPEAVEGLDIEDAALAIWDDRGQRYAVEWIWPNRYGRLLGLISWGESGSYRLRPDGPPDPEAARAAVRRAVELGRAGPFASLAEVIDAIPGPVAPPDWQQP